MSATTAKPLAVDRSRALAIVSRLRPDGDCLIWSGSANNRGYGTVWVDGRSLLVHRVALALATGTEIPPGKLVLHRCARTRCCRPAHLYLGDHEQNAQDAVEAGGIARGTEVYGARLTETRVMAARAMAAVGVTHELIAQANGVARSTISLAVNPRTWKWIA